MAHITGGGLLENIPRVLPESCGAQLDLSSWRLPKLFDWLQRQGNIEQHELYRTFNCGVGMVVAVAPEKVDFALEQLADTGINAWVIGEIIQGMNGVNLN